MEEEEEEEDHSALMGFWQGQLDNCIVLVMEWRAAGGGSDGIGAVEEKIREGELGVVGLRVVFVYW